MYRVSNGSDYETIIYNLKKSSNSIYGKHFENCFDRKLIHLFRGLKNFFKSPETRMQVSVTKKPAEVIIKSR